MCLYVFIGLKSFAPHFQRLQCSACWKLGNGVQFSPIFPPWSQPGSEFNCKLKGFYRHVLHGYIVMFKCNSCWGQIHQHLNGYVGDIYIYIYIYIPSTCMFHGYHQHLAEHVGDTFHAWMVWKIRHFFCAQKGCLPLSFAFRGLPTIWDTPTTEGGFLRKILPFLMTTWWISA